MNTERSSRWSGSEKAARNILGSRSADPEMAASTASNAAGSPIGGGGGTAASRSVNFINESKSLLTSVAAVEGMAHTPFGARAAQMTRRPNVGDTLVRKFLGAGVRSFHLFG